MQVQWFSDNSWEVSPASLIWYWHALTTQTETFHVRFLNDRLNIRLANGNSVTKNVTVTLADLEMALEDMTAAIFWSGMCSCTFFIQSSSIDLYSARSCEFRCEQPWAGWDELFPTGCGKSYSCAIIWSFSATKRKWLKRHPTIEYGTRNSHSC